jgi:hypothetical protein
MAIPSRAKIRLAAYDKPGEEDSKSNNLKVQVKTMKMRIKKLPLSQILKKIKKII